MNKYELINSSTICFSILVTEKCNLNCSYCHFYNKIGNRDLSKCISYDLLKKYLSYIRYLMNEKKQQVQLRFSGGEPLFLGDRLFELSNIAYEITGIKPYVLTNGILITDDVVKKAKESNVSAFVISLENPFKSIDKSMYLDSNLKKINTLNSIELPIIPGVVVVENNYFNRIYDICEFFYNRIGQIPTISEKSFGLFEVPSKQQLSDLEQNLIKIILNYYKKTAVRIFPYITPELCSGFKNQFVLDLPCRDNYKIKNSSYSDIDKIVYSVINKIYLNSFCNKECCLKEGCEKIKNFWYNKMDTYCQFKRIIYNSIYTSFKKISNEN